MRAVARRAESHGWTPVFIEGRDMPPVADALANALAPAHGRRPPLVIFDTWERMTALGGYLRRELLPSLPAQAVVVIAGRRPPESDWFEGGWETLSIEIELEPPCRSRSRTSSERLRPGTSTAPSRSWPGPVGRRSR